MVSPPLIDIFPIQSRAVPKVIGKGPVRIFFYGVDRNHGDRITDFYIMEFTAPLCKCSIQCLRIGAGFAVIYPVSVFYNLNGFFRRLELLFIESLNIHSRQPPAFFPYFNIIAGKTQWCLSGEGFLHIDRVAAVPVSVFKMLPVF